MEWAISLPDTPSRPTILKRAWLSFGRKHTEEARAWLHARAPDEPLRRIYADHLRTLAKGEPVLALELADRTEDEALRHEMRAAAARGWILTDPEAATAWLAEAGLPADLENRVRQSARARPVQDPGDGA